MFKLGVRIMPRLEVLDTQGRAVEMTLRSKDYPVSECRVGRYVSLNVEAKNKDAAIELGKKVSEEVLCNLLIETYEIEVL